MIHIDTIYESQAFALLSRGMKDRHAVAAIYAIMIADNAENGTFRAFDRWCADTLEADDTANAELDRLQKKETQEYTVGDPMDRLVFKAFGIANLHDLQNVLDLTNKVMAEQADEIAKLHRRLVQFESEGKQMIASRDEKIKIHESVVASLERQLNSLRASFGKGYTLDQIDRIHNLHQVLFHDDPTDLQERFARLQEEVFELGQSIGVKQHEYAKLLDRTYSRPAGIPREEVADVAMTFASLCHELNSTIFKALEDGLTDLERPELIAKVREKRKTRHGRGMLPGFDPTQHPLPQGQARESVSMEHEGLGPWTGGTVDVKVGTSWRDVERAAKKAPDPKVDVLNEKTGDYTPTSIFDVKVGDQVRLTVERTRAAAADPDAVERVRSTSITLKRPSNFRWDIGQAVCKTRGSNWRGYVVGFYQTTLTPEGYAVESFTERGNVQIYPVAALGIVYGDD